MLIRDQKVMLDSDLAILYGVSTKVLNQAVKRNIDRFPEDFMFQISKVEYETLRSHIVTSKSRGGRRTLPFVLTEQGIAMLSSVLRSKQAIQVNIMIMRVFVKLRRWANNYEELLKQLSELKQSDFEQNEHIARIYQVIEEILKPVVKKERKRIGFKK